MKQLKIVGNGFLCAVDSEADGKKMIEDLK